MDRIKYHTHILLLIVKIYIKKMKTRKDKWNFVNKKKFSLVWFLLFS